jgi:hypothetical protein
MVCLDGFVYFDRAVTSIVIRCSTTGAVHLDMMDCVDTLGFLLAVDGWLALRPRPSVFMADGGTNFGGGDSAVQDRAKKGQIDLARAQSHLDTKFRFAPPRAPRFRDLVEGFVEATKAAVHSAVHAHTFADEEYFDRAMTSIVVRCSTTGAVHLDIMDCVDTSGFLLAVKGLLALGTRPSVHGRRWHWLQGGRFSPARHRGERSDWLGKSAITLQHHVSMCTSEGSTFPRSRGRICWDDKGGRPIVVCKQTSNSKQKDRERRVSSSLLDIEQEYISL